MVQAWHRILSASEPAIFGDQTCGGLTTLELRSCYLLPVDDGAAVGPIVYCSVGGKATKFALARPSVAVPYCKLRTRLPEHAGECTLSVTGAGKVLVVGLVRSSNAEASNVSAHRDLRTQEKKAQLEIVRRQIAELEALKAAVSGSSRERPAKKPKLAADVRDEVVNARGTTSRKEISCPSSISEAARSQAPMDFGFAKPQAVKPNKQAREEAEMQVLPSGLAFQVVRPGGKGEASSDGNVLQVRYQGRLASSGKQFDKGTIKFRLGRGKVIRGWDQGLKSMVKGEKRTLFVPSSLAYGEKGAPPDIPCNANLVFDVELLSILP